ncbi:MAG TPA: hypothetical protein VFW77_04125 [Candidatus Saccharimonadales bacterium]|nr:hypothetical protein [Candidatus Saccharimonadales bacterium]
MSEFLLPKGYRNTDVIQKRLLNSPEDLFIRRGQNRALKLFHEMAARVPAYQDFLSKNNINPSSIRNAEDMGRVPTIDKDNYLRAYPKEQMCWDGDFGRGRWTISTTSGSTGKPYYFPREASQDWQYAIMADLYLRNNFQIQSKTTLYIVAFPMGAWIGGLFTYEALRLIADSAGYDLSIITPGIHKQGVIDAVKELGDSFDQIIIGAYAPFLKDILDDGKQEGIDWKKYDLGFVFSAEAFSESFRDYVIDVSAPEDIYRFSLNHYGTVDQGTLAHETPESVYIRRRLIQDDKLDLIFPEKHRQPTFAQYNPELFYFEQEENNLICSSYSGLPLVRYNLKDYGGIITKKDVYSVLTEAGIDIKAGLLKAGIAKGRWNLPFIYIYERDDFSVSYYSFLIYPDTVRRALLGQEASLLSTGKFSMHSDYGSRGRQHLKIHIELRKGVVENENIKMKLRDIIHEKLTKESSEYTETFKEVGEVVKPLVELWGYEHAEHFKSGSKQQWVKK